MDLTQSIEPRSDQVNADDLVGGPHTYTIREVRQGAAEQPFDFMLEGTDRAYRPSKTMRRLIVAAWGSDANLYAGRRLTLYREPSIKFGGQTVGGIRISHMSHITKRIEERFQTTRGKRETFTVNPLPDPPAPGPRAAQIAALRKEWNAADPERRKVIEAQVAELTDQPPAEPDPTEDYVPQVLLKPAQLRKLQALAAAKGFRERAERLNWATLVVGYEVTSFSNLTVNQANVLITELEALPDVTA